MKLHTCLLTAALLVAPVMPSLASTPAAPAKSAKPDLVQGEARFTAACASCHGADYIASQPGELKTVPQSRFR